MAAVEDDRVARLRAQAEFMFAQRQGKPTGLLLGRWPASPGPHAQAQWHRHLWRWFHGGGLARAVAHERPRHWLGVRMHWRGVLRRVEVCREIRTVRAMLRGVTELPLGLDMVTGCARV